MKKFLALFIILTLTTFCGGQKERIETQLMNCFYSSCPNNGKQFKNLIIDYEKLLVTEGIMDNAKGKDYVLIYKRLADQHDFERSPSKSFLTEWQKLPKPNIKAVQLYQLKLINTEEYKNSKAARFDIFMDSIRTSGNAKASTIASGILSILSEEDFELDYYKLKTLFVLDLIAPKTKIDLRLPELQNSTKNVDLKGPLKIYVNGENIIFVNKKIVDLNQLKKEINNYESKNKSESVFVLKVEQQTKYNVYMQVQNTINSEIQDLRQKLSENKFKMDYQNLSEEKLNEVNKEYPKTLIEE
ncbi:ExbD/TolR family protein [Zhouia sp. PK063]|uniref:ExbD/TolR family protein n=1 Tax=Zhouia sp. PK063 TaxID=3373602 RepID=UPI0037AD5550